MYFSAVLGGTLVPPLPRKNPKYLISTDEAAVLEILRGRGGATVETESDQERSRQIQSNLEDSRCQESTGIGRNSYESREIHRNPGELFFGD